MSGNQASGALMENSARLRFVEDPPDLGETVALAELMRALSGRWQFSILRSLMSGPLRFADVRRANVGISQSVLSHLLREMERDGFVRRTVFSERPPHVEYELTEAARDLRIILDAFQVWHRKHQGPRCLDFSARQ